MRHADAITFFISRFKYERYLEIGVEVGVTFNGVHAPVKFTVDPHFQVDKATIHGEAYEVTSDEFFSDNLNLQFDLAFIDGLHTFD